MKTKPVVLVCLFFFATQMYALADEGPATVNQKLLKAFQAAYPLAEKVDWVENGDHYFVHFRDHEVTSEIEYDHEGNYVASERFYKDAGLLPLQLSWELHKKFTSKSVYGITETNSDSETYYYIKLEDNKEWMTVKGSSGGVLFVVEKFNKQS